MPLGQPIAAGTSTYTESRKHLCTPEIKAFLKRVERTLSESNMYQDIQINKDRFKIIGVYGDSIDIADILSTCNKNPQIAIEADDDTVTISKSSLLIRSL